MRPYYFDFEQQQARRARAVAMARPIAWHRTPLSPPPRRRGGFEWLRRAVTLVGLWRKRVRDRQELAGLDYRMQRDIGVTPSEIAAECSKPFWRA
jgi:uncharacterized protein YjiS (DUF1127 family)